MDNNPLYADNTVKSNTESSDDETNLVINEAREGKGQNQEVIFDQKISDCESESKTATDNLEEENQYPTGSNEILNNDQCESEEDSPVIEDMVEIIELERTTMMKNLYGLLQKMSRYDDKISWKNHISDTRIAQQILMKIVVKF